MMPAESTALPAERSKGGRPAKVTLSDEQLLEIAAWAARGLRDEDIASRLGFTDRTLRNIKKRDPRLHMAIDKGWGALHEELVGSLTKRALDPKNPTGATAAIFLLKTRFGYRDQGEPPPPPDQARIRLEMILPRSLSRAAYAKQLEGRTASRQLEAGEPIEAQVVSEEVVRA